MVGNLHLIFTHLFFLPAWFSSLTTSFPPWHPPVYAHSHRLPIGAVLPGHAAQLLRPTPQRGLFSTRSPRIISSSTQESSPVRGFPDACLLMAFLVPYLWGNAGSPLPFSHYCIVMLWLSKLVVLFFSFPFSVLSAWEAFRLDPRADNILNKKAKNLAINLGQVLRARRAILKKSLTVSTFPFSFPHLPI